MDKFRSSLGSKSENYHTYGGNNVAKNSERYFGDMKSMVEMGFEPDGRVKMLSVQVRKARLLL